MSELFSTSADAATNLSMTVRFWEALEPYANWARVCVTSNPARVPIANPVCACWLPKAWTSLLVLDSSSAMTSTHWRRNIPTFVLPMWITRCRLMPPAIRCRCRPIL